MAQIISKKAKNILCARNFPEDKKMWRRLLDDFQ